MFSISSSSKIILSIFIVIISIIGFMVKLPSVFRHHDKELHFLFYFFAALFFNILYQRKHLFIFSILLGFSIFIELFQSFSNRFFTNRIHGNFDIDDVFSNFYGLLCFSFFYMLFKLVKYIFNKLSR
jgi:hypothetical protein